MDELLQSLTNILGAMFVLGTMMSMGLAFSVQQIISPLRDWRLDVRALLANFILVPLICFVVIRLLSLEADYAIGIAIMALCAGAPILPKYVAIIGGDEAKSVGILFLLVIATIFFLPVALPLVLKGVTVDPIMLAKNLLLASVVPLAAGLFIKARYPGIAAAWRPTSAQIANVGLSGSIILLLIRYFNDVLALFGTGAIFALFLTVILGYGAGFLCGARDVPKERELLGFGTSQRNISAGMVVAASNFSSSPKVLLMIIIGGLMSNIILLLLSAEMAKRDKGTTATQP